jgi:tetratricopeptide (TPR) repeat protein
LARFGLAISEFSLELGCSFNKDWEWHPFPVPRPRNNRDANAFSDRDRSIFGRPSSVEHDDGSGRERAEMTSETPPLGRVGGRYRVVEELARGGMGVVLRAIDEVAGRDVAIKRALPEAGIDGERALQREYHILAGIRHPSVIEVYDYGSDQSGPFYTMELLDGSDLAELSPMDWATACRYLRDVASSLALLNARKLVHRDVSLRNVRVSASGRAKLLDFGAVATFGLLTTIVGTPPYVPPEALYGQALDGRADLYSLGSLAYRVLTGRVAFAARTLQELPQAWRIEPLPPAVLRPDIPEWLSEMVLALLSLDPAARPPTAAAVIDRINAKSGLEQESVPEVARAYLYRPKLVGREGELGVLRQHVERAVAGQGGAVVVEGEAGAGRTRLLEEAIFEAQLKGALILSARGDAHPEEYRVARALSSMLTRLVPETPGSIPPIAGFSSSRPPRPRRFRTERPPNQPVDPSEHRASLGAAFVESIVAACRRQPVVVAVDDLHLADEPSAALITALARRSSGLPLLVVATELLDNSATNSTARLRDVAHALRLRPLKTKESEQLVRELFGDAAHAGRVGSWLHDHGAGWPRRILELAQHLVTSGVARYADGAWVLPQEPGQLASPGEEAELFEATVRGLTKPALELGQAVSLCDGDIPLELAVRLAQSDGQTAFSLLDELVMSDILVGTPSGFGFRTESLRLAMQHGCSAERRAPIELRIADHLLADEREPLNALRAGRHLIRGGRTEIGAELVLTGTAALRVRGFEGLEAASAALEEALVAFEDQRGAGRYLLFAALAALSISGWMTDRKFADRYGDRAIELGLELTGLERARKAAQWMGAPLAALVGVGVSALLHLARRRSLPSELGHFTTLFESLFQTSATRVGVSAICLDGVAVERTLAKLEPLTLFPRSHICGLIHAYCTQILLAVSGREAEARTLSLELLQELAHPKWARQLGDVAFKPLVAGQLLTLGMLEACMDNGTALARADQLESVGLSFYAKMASQIRLVHHAYRGEVAEVRRYIAEVETQAAEGGSTWQTELLVTVTMIRAYQSTGDVVGLRQTLEQLRSLAKKIPSLRVHAAMARAAYQLERGRTEVATEAYERALPESIPRHVPGWADARGQYARALIELGRLGEARRVCLEALECMAPGDDEFAVLYLEPQRQLARAEALLGDVVSASARLDRLLTRYRDRGPVTLSAIHVAYADVSVHAGDRLGFDTHVALLETLARSTENPGLLAQVARLSATGRRWADAANADPAGISDHPPGSGLEAMCRELMGRPLAERAAKALELIIQETDAEAGWFFIRQDMSLTLLARTSAAEPPPWLQAWLEDSIDHHESDNLDGPTATSHTPELSTVIAERAGHLPLVLVATSAEPSVVIGAVALRFATGERRAGRVPQLPRVPLVDMIANAFSDTDRTVKDP